MIEGVTLQLGGAGLTGSNPAAIGLLFHHQHPEFWIGHALAGSPLLGDAAALRQHRRGGAFNDVGVITPVDLSVPRVPLDQNSCKALTCSFLARAPQYSPSMSVGAAANGMPINGCNFR